MTWSYVLLRGILRAPHCHCLQEDKEKSCHILSYPQEPNCQHSQPGPYNIQGEWCCDQLAMSAMGARVGNCGMSPVYLLTPVSGFLGLWSGCLKPERLPPVHQLSAPQADLIKVSRIPPSLFNRCKVLPGVFGSSTPRRGAPVLCVLRPGCAALSLSSSLLRQVFSPLAI